VLTDPPRGCPFGAAAIIVSEAKSDDDPRIRAEYNDFHRICSIPELNTHGVSPPPLSALPVGDNPTKKYYISIAVSERRVKRTGSCPVRHRTGAFYGIS